MTLPPLYTNYSMAFPGSPQARSKGMALSSAQLQHHDIDAYELLSEIEMDMYSEVFITNFGLNDTKYLNRNRLKTLRLKDFPSMGITQYDHQKIIYDHIVHALEFEFKSPVRKNQVRSKMELRFPGRNFVTGGGGGAGGLPSFDGIKMRKLRVEDLQIPEREMRSAAAKTTHTVVSTRRRRSFDNNVWQCISHLRTTDHDNAAAAAAIREGNPEALVKIETLKHDSRRRRSFDHKNAATGYGNRALGADMIHRELHELQSKHMHKLKRVIGCAEAHIMFVHSQSHDLLLVTEHAVWYRLPIGFSIPGHSAETGHIIVTDNAYEDQLFNSNLDEKLGIVSKEVMCYPLRGARGAGSVIGVLMCTNKSGGFDNTDEEALATVAQHIAEDLMTKFHELTTVADIMYGTAVSLHVHGGIVGERRGSQSFHNKVTRATSASVAQQTRPYNPKDHETEGVHSIHGNARLKV